MDTRAFRHALALFALAAFTLFQAGCSSVVESHVTIDDQRLPPDPHGVTFRLAASGEPLAASPRYPALYTRVVGELTKRGWVEVPYSKTAVADLEVRISWATGKEDLPPGPQPAPDTKKKPLPAGPPHARYFALWIMDLKTLETIYAGKASLPEGDGTVEEAIDAFFRTFPGKAGDDDWINVAGKK